MDASGTIPELNLREFVAVGGMTTPATEGLVIGLEWWLVSRWSGVISMQRVCCHRPISWMGWLKPTACAAATGPLELKRLQACASNPSIQPAAAFYSAKVGTSDISLQTGEIERNVEKRSPEVSRSGNLGREV